MKKPNITEGEWRLIELPNGMDYYITSEPCHVIKVEHSQYWRDKEEAKLSIPRWMADAKAISAVPKLIDALIEARNLINQKYFIREGDSLVLSKIEQALKKAGVTEI